MFNLYPTKIQKEDFIKSLLSKPFKVPLPNWTPGPNSRTLGIKGQGTRQALYDIDDENALILWSPPTLSQDELLKADKYIISTNLLY